MKHPLIIQLEKWFPFQGERAHSSVFFVCMLRGWSFKNKIERRRGVTEQQQQQTYQFTFSTEYKYTANPDLYETQEIYINTLFISIHT